MNPAALLALLVEFQREKAALYRRHVAVARVAGQYDINNTYQYVIAREEQHLDWVRQAILDMGGAEPEAGPFAEPDKPRDEAGLRALVGADADQLEAIVARWRSRLPAMTNARHRKMLELTLGEMLEQARFFRQAAAGRLDLLGRRTGGPRTQGGVLPSRSVG
ncbi:MAG TPA: hypothetical protein VK911_01580 [Vicinamibacterales bacterium]|nr:hypothetical protein [Vicinamibacterales bacterium]